MNFALLASQTETNKLEHKSTLRYDIEKSMVTDIPVEMVLKTLAAFLNSDGGTLLIGVDKDKNVIGLDLDYATFSGNDKEDQFRLCFDNLVQVHLGNHIHSYLTVETPAINGKRIFAVTVKKKSKDPVYLKKKDKDVLYIRRSSSTAALETLEAAKYMISHWGDNPNTVQDDIDFGSEKEFKNSLGRIIANKNSSYYKEIEENWNYYELNDDSTLLKELLVTNLYKSVKLGLLQIISDHALYHLNNDRDAKYLYNQGIIHPHDCANEGNNFPIYYDIRVINILYSTAIYNKADLPFNMQTIYASMIGLMVENLVVQKEHEHKEYPSNYHWLIGEIFGFTGHWLDKFGEADYFNPKSNFKDFIPFCINLCLRRLYTGIKNGKVTVKFVASCIYYNVLSTYFSVQLVGEMRTIVEKEIIKEIPKELVEPFLEFALDEKYALQFSAFCEGRFRGCDDREREILTRMRSMMILNGQIS